MYTVAKKRLDNEAAHIVPLWEEYAECIYYLGECVQTCTPWLSQIVLGFIKSIGHSSLAFASSV
jgi:hypothetical protein